MKALRKTIFSGVRTWRWRGIKPTLTAVCTYGKQKGLLYTNEYILVYTNTWPPICSLFEKIIKHTLHFLSEIQSAAILSDRKANFYSGQKQFCGFQNKTYYFSQKSPRRPKHVIFLLNTNSNYLQNILLHLETVS